MKRRIEARPPKGKEAEWELTIIVRGPQCYVQDAQTVCGAELSRLKRQHEGKGAIASQSMRPCGSCPEAS